VSRSARRCAAAAAEVLGAELGLDAENTAKWLHEYRELPAKREELVRLRATSLPLSLTALCSGEAGSSVTATQCCRRMRGWNL